MVKAREFYLATKNEDLFVDVSQCKSRDFTRVVNKEKPTFVPR